MNQKAKIDIVSHPLITILQSYALFVIVLSMSVVIRQWFLCSMCLKLQFRVFVIGRIPNFKRVLVDTVSKMM